MPSSWEQPTFSSGEHALEPAMRYAANGQIVTPHRLLRRSVQMRASRINAELKLRGASVPRGEYYGLIAFSSDQGQASYL